MSGTIVVGYEPTEQGRDAIELGAVLARITGGPMVVLTVGVEDGAERLASFVSAHLPELELAVRARSLETGSPATELKRLAVAEGAWAIVVGSTHRSGLGRVLPGSVGERLLRGAPCAVAVAPRGFAAGRAERRAQRLADLSLSDEKNGVPVIGVGFDGTAESEEALAVAAALARRAQATVRVIAVAPPGGSPTEIQSMSAHPFPDLQERLHDAVAALPHEVRPKAIHVQGDPAAILLGMAEQGIDLLVMGSRGAGPIRHTLLGSVSRQVMHVAPCPVLITPRPDESTSLALPLPEGRARI